MWGDRDCRALLAGKFSRMQRASTGQEATRRCAASTSLVDSCDWDCGLPWAGLPITYLRRKRLQPFAKFSNSDPATTIISQVALEQGFWMQEDWPPTTAPTSESRLPRPWHKVRNKLAQTTLAKVVAARVPFEQLSTIRASAAPMVGGPTADCGLVASPTGFTLVSKSLPPPLGTRRSSPSGLAVAFTSQTRHKVG